MGIWVQPVAGTYYNYLFAANAGNGTAVAYKTPLTNSSVPEWQFNAGGVASDVVQDMFGNVYVAEYGTPNIAVFTPPFGGCTYPSGCSPSYSIADPCGTVDWLATDGKGDVYSNNYCGYVTLFVTPIAAGEVGTKLVGTAFSQPGGMIVDKHNELVVNDQGTDKITSYGLNVLRSEATARFTLAPYSGAIFGIGLDKTNKFLWGQTLPPTPASAIRSRPAAPAERQARPIRISSFRLAQRCAPPAPNNKQEPMTLAVAQYELPVAEAYRLDLTASVLRRLSTNVVDVLAPEGVLSAGASGSREGRCRCASLRRSRARSR